MRERLRRLLRTAAIALGLAAVVFVVFGYRQVQGGRCPTCWTPMAYVEAGVALSSDLRLPLRRRVAPTGECPSGILRFVAADHVHGDDPRWGGDAGMTGPYLRSTTSSGVTVPSEFALALMWDPAFSDYVAARVAEGSLEVETVRRLIAVPPARSRSATAWVGTGDRMALLHTGAVLVAEYRKVAPWDVDLWNGDVPEPLVR